MGDLADYTDEEYARSLADRFSGTTGEIWFGNGYAKAILVAMQRARLKERETPDVTIEELADALDAMLDWALANRGTSSEFISCYTYAHGKKEPKIERAKAILARYQGEIR